MRAYVLVIGLLAAAAGLSPAPSGAAEPRSTTAPDLSVEQIAKRTLPALVTVVVKNAQGQVVKNGSGFFVAARRVATNLHVISGGGSISVVTADRKEFPAVSAQ